MVVFSDSFSFENSKQAMELEKVDELLIPAEDIMFQVSLKDRGMINYHHVFLTSKRKEAVAKRPSGKNNQQKPLIHETDDINYFWETENCL